MAKIVECVPNFSEGRDKEKINRIVSVFDKYQGIRMINCEPDGDYNRTVVTLIGDPETMQKAVLEMVGVAKEEIDLNHQTGQHPRMGAVDVIPFIPIEGVTINDCVDFAKTLGKNIASVYNIPVFLYAEAASKEDRMSLPNIRKGEFEGMDEKLKDQNWHPDFGPAAKHPTFGVVAVGARQFLIAYNIDLETTDMDIPEKIARAIRKSSGGFQYIQAGPAFLEKYNHVQVTMNILDYKKNPIYRIFEVVKMEAKRYHIEVKSAELVGLMPKDALIRSLAYYLDMDDDIRDPKQLSLAELTELARKYLMFRDFDINKIIESYL